MLEQSPLYSHPNIRELSHGELQSRLQTIRSRRLLAALEYKSTAEKRMQKLSNKLSERWDRLNNQNLRDLDRAMDLIEKIDKNIAKQIEVSHELSLASNEEFEI